MQIKRNKIRSTIIIKELLWIFTILCVVSVFVILIFHLYEIDLTTMLSLEYGAFDSAKMAHDFLIGIKNGNGFRILLNSIFSDNLETSVLHKIGLFLCCILVDNFGTAVNLYYFSSYISVALGMYFAMRILHKNQWISAVAGIIYTFLPYHHLRGENYVFLANYYMVPLACAIIIRLLHYEEKKDKFFYIISSFIFVLLGCTDIYYSFFSTVILLFVMGYVVYHTKSLKEGRFFIFLCIIQYIIFSLTHIFYIIKYFNTTNSGERITQNTSSLSVIQDYGLRIIQLIYPIQNHRWYILALMRNNLDKFLTDNETKMVSLGFIMSAGFIISVFLLLFSTKKNQLTKDLQKYGALNLFILLIANVGGLNIFIGIFCPDILFYNRMNVFIAAFSLIAIMEILQNVNEKYEEKYFFKKIRIVLIGVLVIFAVLDQTPAFSKEKNREIWRENHSIKRLVEEIDLLTEDDVHILILPIMEESNSKLNEMQRNRQLWPYLYSENIKWIMGMNIDEKNSLKVLNSMPVNISIDYMTQMDFDGILIDKDNYEEDVFVNTKAILDELLGKPLVISETGVQYYYSFLGYKERLDKIYDKERLKEIQNFSDSIRWGDAWYFNSNNLCVVDNSEKMEDGCIIIGTGGTQFGPYWNFDEGRYQLEVNGENMNSFKLSLAYGVGEGSIDYKIINENKNRKLLEFCIDQNEGKDVEFIIMNLGNMDIKLNYYLLRKLN